MALLEALELPVVPLVPLVPDKPLDPVVPVLPEAEVPVVEVSSSDELLLLCGRFWRHCEKSSENFL